MGKNPAQVQQRVKGNAQVNTETERYSLCFCFRKKSNVAYTLIDVYLIDVAK